RSLWPHSRKSSYAMMEETEEMTPAEQAENPVEMDADQPSADQSAMAVNSTIDTPIDSTLLRNIVEGAILAAGQPLTVARIMELFEPEQAPSKEAVLTALEEIQIECAG